MASQAGRQTGSYLPRDSTTSQEVGAVPQEGSSSVTSQAGRQVGTQLSGECATSKEASTSSHNIPTEEGPS